MEEKDVRRYLSNDRAELVLLAIREAKKALERVKVKVDHRELDSKMFYLLRKSFSGIEIAEGLLEATPRLNWIQKLSWMLIGGGLFMIGYLIGIWIFG